MSKNLQSLSKFLALVLRHKPEEIGITIGDGGWVNVADLIDRCGQRGQSLNLPTLRTIVENDAKGRYSFNEDSTLIRANQGHSISVEMNFVQEIPPPVLFHGTADRNVLSILEKGIVRGSRQYVHLSVDHPTALSVGRRHGRPVVFRVDAARMHEQGHKLHLSENKIWLADHVPPSYLSLEPLE